MKSDSAMRLISAACFLAMTPAIALAGIVTAGMDGRPAISKTSPEIASFEFFTTEGNLVQFAFAKASVAGLHADSIRANLGPFGLGEGPRVFAGFASDQDILFDYAANFGGGTPEVPEEWVSLSLNAVLRGGFIQVNSGGRGGATATTRVSGQVYSAPDPSAFLSSGITVGAVADSINGPEFLGLVQTGTFWVPRGSTIRINTDLRVTTFSNSGGTIDSNFSRSFRFDPDQFFTINTPGITANSLSMGLVNNQLPAFQTNTVPEPSSLTLLGIAAACLCGQRWRRRRKAAQVV